jgi:sulfite exporter TauE/SafE
MVIELFQVFSIGFGWGFTGPCLFYCAPVILSFTSGMHKDYRRSLFDILLFFGGRLSAYILLAALAGISGMLLRRFIDSSLTAYLNPLAGLISIGLGIILLAAKKDEEGNCKATPHKAAASGGLFAFGFIIGVSPCAPLVALLFEIALISKNALDGALYGLFFGLGTFISGLIITAALAGLSIRIPEKLLKSPTAKDALRITCALLLVLFGLWFIFGQKR